MSAFADWADCQCGKPKCRTKLRECADGGKIVLMRDGGLCLVMAQPVVDGMITVSPVCEQEALKLADQWAKAKGGWLK